MATFASTVEDMVQGRLPPNNPLFMAGGPSNYTHEVLRPHGGGHFLKQSEEQAEAGGKARTIHAPLTTRLAAFKVDAAPVYVESRGRATYVDHAPRRQPSENEQTSFDRIQPGAIEALTAPGPAVGRDLKEIGLARTQELIDAEREVLHYTLFTRDVIVNSTSERERTRTFELYYHVIDGSLRVFEPAQSNSGLVQVQQDHAGPLFTVRNLPPLPHRASFASGTSHPSPMAVARMGPTTSSPAPSSSSAAESSRSSTRTP